MRREIGVSALFVGTRYVVNITIVRTVFSHCIFVVKVGLERQTSADTVLQYVTTGVLLQKLIKQKSLNEFTHIIIDEVHERNQEMDFLLVVVRKFLFQQPSFVKVPK